MENNNVTLHRDKKKLKRKRIKIIFKDKDKISNKNTIKIAKSIIQPSNKLVDNKLQNIIPISKKNEIIYDKSTNYYLEYWTLFSKNEYVLAKIKEVVHEIKAMKEHIDELKLIVNNNKNIN